MKTGSEKKSGQSTWGKKRMKFEKMHCEACDAPFWVDRNVEPAAADYVCPYCGESKDVARSEPEERKG